MKQILTRLALTLPVVWLVDSLVFLLIHLVPGDPILQMLGEGATPTDITALRHQYGLDLPLGQISLHVGILDNVTSKVGTLEVPVYVRPVNPKQRAAIPPDAAPAPCPPRCPMPEPAPAPATH